MSRSNVAMPTLLLLLFTMPLDAAVIERDWQTPGDGLLTFDTVNQREWLDLTETLLIQFSSNSATGYQLVLDETSVGGRFEGFRVASETDVIDLAESAGIDTGTDSAASNSDSVSSLIELLGATFGPEPIGAESMAFVVDFPIVASVFTSPPFDRAGLFAGITQLDPGGIAGVTGVWLYRQVPEPSGAVLLFCSLSVLGSARRFKF